VDKNRYIRSRESAGLSTAQAARLVGVPVADLKLVEEAQQPSAAITLKRLADLYGCSIEWLTGQAPYRDLAAVDRIPGGRDLPFCDRDALAELFASLPGRARSQA
jgi:transcriptional regulator with XRE-family HTH domain